MEAQQREEQARPRLGTVGGGGGGEIGGMQAFKCPPLQFRKLIAFQAPARTSNWSASLPGNSFGQAGFGLPEKSRKFLEAQHPNLSALKLYN